MTFSQIQQLLAIEKFGILSAAAMELNTSQPALSRPIEELEAVILRQFHRIKRPVDDTTADNRAVIFHCPLPENPEKWQTKTRRNGRHSVQGIGLHKTSPPKIGRPINRDSL